MTRRVGRPSSPEMAKNRRHTIILTYKAELIFREICKKKDSKWIHEYVSQKLIDDNKDQERGLLMYELNKLQGQRNRLDDEIQAIAAQIKGRR